MWLLLSIDSKISVSEIIDVLEENQYNVSKHLRILKNAGVVYEKRRTDGLFIIIEIVMMFLIKQLEK